MDRINRYVVRIGDAYVREYDEDFEFVEVVRDINKAYQIPNFTVARKIEQTFGGTLYRVDIHYMTALEIEREEKSNG